MRNRDALAVHLLTIPTPDPAPMLHAEIVRQSHELADAVDEPGDCYFIGGDVGPIKIGHSIDTRSRLQTLQNGSPIRLRMYASRAGGELREGAYHFQFANDRLHGEWFTRTPEIEAEIARLIERSEAA